MVLVQEIEPGTWDLRASRENMNVLLRLVCFIALLTSLKADECEQHHEKIIIVSSAYEMDVRSCPITTILNKISITWFKNDSIMPISTERDMRIHQYNDKVWFVPSKVEDSGYYYCVVRNSTHCIKNKLTINFVENNTNLCYNNKALYKQKLPIAQDGNIVCPYLEFLKNENSELPKIQWYKDCKSLFLDSVNFIGKTNKLLIRNVNEAHRGNYTCQTTYTHLGKQYPVTRTIEFSTTESNTRKRPVIVSPTNETVEIDLGSQVQLLCNVTGHWDDDVYWKWNGSVIDDDDPVLVEMIRLEKNPSTKRNDRIIAELNISAVENRFYLYPFVCFAKNSQGLNTAYVKLIYPAPDFRVNLIVGLLILTGMVVSVVCVYTIFKIDIVLWYRSAFLSTGVIEDGKLYDAYVLYPKTQRESHHQDVATLVLKILPEVLERQCGYKLFIFGRDEFPGQAVANVIDENIKLCRRLIIILPKSLSFALLKNMSEEQIAVYNALVQDGMKVILIEMEEIKDYTVMPESIQYIKQKHGALLWSGDFTEKTQCAKTKFWKRVRYRMPPKSYPPSSPVQLLKHLPCDLTAG
ncbi:interleukin-1 receptor type 1 isoform X3 [Erinaceus europaeus]|uniref:Interleukin-1 receptor type 1 isoform X3 n=1 Tax=Erinaceus europaeus TaxID=9365 RepID=A0ABM3X3G9_ERIEU|nr:interleukin-1 receptor type 1 isoform X3 [Erinaceus europaeus]